MNETRVVQRKLPFTEILPGRLADFRLVFNKRSVKYPGAASANVVPQLNSVVEGVLYKLQDQQSIEMMDPYEGYPIRYSRSLQTVATLHGDVSAWVYTANPDYIAEGLKPARWYLNHLLAGRPHLSEAYYLGLSQTECLPDSDIEPD